MEKFKFNLISSGTLELVGGPLLKNLVWFFS
jgi:hypothetical protein